MRNVHIFFLILTYCRPSFTSAQVNPDRIGDTSELDDFDKWNYPANRTGQTMSSAVGVAVSNRFQDGTDQTTGKESRRILEEFRADLTSIQNLARRAHPVTTNVRRSLQSRRTLEFKLRMLKTFLGNLLINFIAALEDFIPQLKPITKYFRKIIVMKLLR